MIGNWSENPIKLYQDPKIKLQLAKAVALDVLSVPAGEPPNERIVSIVSRVIKFDRSRMSSGKLCSTTLVKKNTIALDVPSRRNNRYTVQPGTVSGHKTVHIPVLPMYRFGVPVVTLIQRDAPGSQ